LSPFFALVLDLCSQRTRNGAELAQETADILGVEPDKAWLQTNLEALARLRSLGLVNPV